MELKRIADWLDEQEWLQPAAETLQGAIRSAYEAGGPAGQQIKNFLHGTWLGHPLHAVITDVPTGAWTAAAVLDTAEALSGRRELAPGADLAVAVGAVGAASAALAGLTDWEHLPDRAGRLGLVHAALNTTALLLYLGSLTCRGRGERASGRALAYLGLGVMTAAAWLGGELVYGLEIGVNHAAGETLPDQFVPAMAAADLGNDQLRRVQIGETSVLLVRHGGVVYALADTCAHLGCSLADGRLEDDSVVCGCHGSRYRLDDGRVLDGPATFDQPSFDVRVRQGQIEVRQPAGM